VEPDFSGFHVAIAYALRRETPPEDPYALPFVLPEYQGCEEIQRNDVKNLALIALNASGTQSTINAYRSNYAHEYKQRKIGPTTMGDKLLYQLLEGFMDLNTPIKDDISSDLGVMLQAIDSSMTNSILKHFTQRDIPVLTVHDSYIIEEQHEQELKRVLRDVFVESLKLFEPTIKTKKTTKQAIALIDKEDKEAKKTAIDDYFRSLSSSVNRCAGYRARLGRFLEWQKSRGLSQSV
jgi:hypothetical protein